MEQQAELLAHYYAIKQNPRYFDGHNDLSQFEKILQGFLNNSSNVRLRPRYLNNMHWF